MRHPPPGLRNDRTGPEYRHRSAERASELRFRVPLARLERATCCLGDVSAQTLCSITNSLVSRDRRAKVIVSSNRRAVSRYPPRTPSVVSGHVHTRAAGVWPQWVAHCLLETASSACRSSCSGDDIDNLPRNIDHLGQPILADQARDRAKCERRLAHLLLACVTANSDLTATPPVDRDREHEG
jgi:hypothetical protein